MPNKEEEIRTVDTTVGSGGDRRLAQVGRTVMSMAQMFIVLHLTLFPSNGRKIEAFVSAVISHLVYIKL